MVEASHKIASRFQHYDPILNHTANLHELIGVLSDDSACGEPRGQLTLQFSVAPDASIAAPSTVTVSNGTDYTKNISGQWSQAKTLSAVPFGSYQVSVKTINSNGKTWLGSAAPATINLNSVSTNKVSISYTQGVEYGSITVYLN